MSKAKAQKHFDKMSQAFFLVKTLRREFWAREKMYICVCVCVKRERQKYKKRGAWFCENGAYCSIVEWLYLTVEKTMAAAAKHCAQKRTNTEKTVYFKYKMNATLTQFCAPFKYYINI